MHISQGSVLRQAQRGGVRTSLVALLVLLASTLGASPAYAAAPVASNDHLVVSNDGEAFLFLDASDDDGDVLTYAVVTPPAHGVLSGDCTDADCVYTPTAGYVGADFFTWRANDGTSNSNLATVSIDVVAPGSPTASPGSEQATVGVPLDITLFGSSETADDLTFAIVTAPTKGTLGTIGAPDCSFGSCSAVVTYTAGASSTGPDFFRFSVNDGTLTSAPARVDIQLVAPGAPVAYAGSVEAAENGVTVLTLSADDENGDALTFAIASPPAHGDLGPIGTPDCSSGFCEASVSYTPDTDYLGPDSFTFTASDGTFTSDPATVSIDVVTAPCQGTVVDNGTIKIGVNCKGELNVGDVGLRFMPTDNDSTAPGCPCEGWGAADDTSDVTGFANQSAGTSDNLSLVSFVHDADSATSVTEVGTTLRVTHDYQPSTQTPNAYEVTVSIANISTSPVALRYRRVMDWDIEPTAFSEFVTINKGTASEIVFTSDDGFATADALAGPSDIGNVGNFVDAGPADHGALFDFNFGSLAVGGTKTFKTFYGAAATESAATTALNAVGAEAFTLGQSSTPDGPTLGTPNTFFFAFGAVGGTPIFAPDAVNDTLTTQANTAGVKDVLANDTDANGDELTVTTLTPTAAHGTVSCTAAGLCTYTPNTNYSGPDSFTYSISDGHGGTDSATVAVTVTPAAANTPPNAVNDTLTTPEDTAAVKNVLTNDTDADGNTLTVTTLNPTASHGTVSCTAAGACTYTPAANYHGPDSFTYAISDGNGGTDTATVSITVTPVNDAPNAANDTLTTPEDTAAVKNVLTNDTDIDGGALTVTTLNPTASHGTVSCTAAGNCTYTPAANYHGPDSFTYAISDGNVGGTDTATVSITVTPVNDAPNAVDDTLTTSQDTAAVKNVLTNDSDVDGNALTVTTLSPTASHGTVSCTATGNCTYTPAAGYSGPDSFTYAITDGSLTDTATVSITVAPAGELADVGIVKASLFSPARVGNAAAYRLTVHNASTVAATSVTVHDTLPAGFKIRTVSGSGCSRALQQLTCTIGTMAPGSTVVIRVDGAFVRGGSISNTATVSADNDGTTANNSDTLVVNVLGKTCTIVGTFGDDIPLLGTNRADVICGLSGNDQINAKLGNDTVYGNEGNDRIMGLGGNDLIDGGPGVDTTTYSAALQSVRVDLSLRKATGQGTDTFVSIENILGSKFRDTLIGNALRNYIAGGAGGDVLSGLGGPDVLAGGGGADTLRGGGGNDTLLGGTGGDTCLQGTGTGRKASC